LGVGYFFAERFLTTLRMQNFDRGCTNDRAVLADGKYFFPFFFSQTVQLAVGAGYGISGHRGYNFLNHNLLAQIGCNFSLSKHWSALLFVERQRIIERQNQQSGKFSTNTLNCSILYFLK
jgi:hypothetical protein